MKAAGKICRLLFFIKDYYTIEKMAFTLSFLNFF